MWASERGGPGDRAPASRPARAGRVTILAVLAGTLFPACDGAGERSAPPSTPASTAGPAAPVAGVAATAACQTDAATIRTAQDAFHLLEGRYAPLDELVATGYLRSAPAGYGAVTVGEPEGGYTLDGGRRGCPDVPVAGGPSPPPAT
jgi:hypothetical protein